MLVSRNGWSMRTHTLSQQQVKGSGRLHAQRLSTPELRGRSPIFSISLLAHSGTLSQGGGSHSVRLLASFRRGIVEFFLSAHGRHHAGLGGRKPGIRRLVARQRKSRRRSLDIHWRSALSEEEAQSCREGSTYLTSCIGVLTWEEDGLPCGVHSAAV